MDFLKQKGPLAREFCNTLIYIISLVSLKPSSLQSVLTELQWNGMWFFSLAFFAVIFMEMLRKQREELLEDVPNEPDAAPVPDDAAVSTDNIERLTELIGQMKPMYRDPLRLLAMGYTNREIAKSLGLTDEVVRTRLFRGRKLLWKEMNSHE